MKYLKTRKNRHNYLHPLEPRYVSLDAVPSKRKFDGTIKVVTYNIKLAKNTRKALELLGSYDELDNADIVCLQEMDPKSVQLIARALKYNFVYYPAILHPRSGKDFGNAILSKWPIISDEKIIFPKSGPGRLQRIAVKATVLINKKAVTVFCVHMKVFARKRQRRVPIDTILASIEPSNKYCIIAGDFNTFSKSNCRAILAPFQEADFKLATDKIGWTYKYWYLLNKKSILDHIFTRGMNVINAGKVINRKPSDHIPVWGEFQIN